MNIEEYKERIDKMHTVTGVPSYWEQLQEMTSDRDRWRRTAEVLASELGKKEYAQAEYENQETVS